MEDKALLRRSGPGAHSAHHVVVGAEKGGGDASRVWCAPASDRRPLRWSAGGATRRGNRSRPVICSPSGSFGYSPSVRSWSAPPEYGVSCCRCLPRSWVVSDAHHQIDLHISEDGMLVSHDCSKLHQRKKNPTLRDEAAQVEKRVGEALDAAVGTYVSSGEYIDCRSMRPSEYRRHRRGRGGACPHSEGSVGAAPEESAARPRPRGGRQDQGHPRRGNEAKQHHRDSGVEKYSICCDTQRACRVSQCGVICFTYCGTHACAGVVCSF